VDVLAWNGPGKGRNCPPGQELKKGPEGGDTGSCRRRKNCSESEMGGGGKPFAFRTKNQGKKNLGYRSDSGLWEATGGNKRRPSQQVNRECFTI